MFNNNYDVSGFETDWRKLSIKICQAIYTRPEVQVIKAALQKNGFLSLEEKSRFIDYCNEEKYKVIQKKHGLEGSEGYKAFTEVWTNWFQKKGVESEHSRGQRDSVEHIMFGSTPDPSRFLMNFEQEIIGSLAVLGESPEFLEKE